MTRTHRGNDIVPTFGADFTLYTMSQQDDAPINAHEKRNDPAQEQPESQVHTKGPRGRSVRSDLCSPQISGLRKK